MNPQPLKIVICGLSITSSWGNGHATTFRALVKELAVAGHEVLFLERDRPWYAENRDLPEPPYCKLGLYSTIEEFKDRFTRELKDADAVIVGSYVEQGIELGKYIKSVTKGVFAFYDIDTPVTLAYMNQPRNEYINEEMIPLYDLYLSFTGGPILDVLEEQYGSPKARALYCSVDTENYYPETREKKYDLAYLGTYSTDRQPGVEELLINPAHQWREGRFMVAGAQYPDWILWPKNVTHVHHIAPHEHRKFYNEQRFTLNITRDDMVRVGYSPSVRLFEAAACGTPIISDYWPGLDTIFQPGSEIIVVKSGHDVLGVLQKLSAEELKYIGARARAKVLALHTSRHRAQELITYLRETQEQKTYANRTFQSYQTVYSPARALVP